MKNILLTPIALLLVAAPAALVVFFIIPHAGFVATFAVGVLVGAGSTAFAGIQAWRILGWRIQR